MLLTEHTLESFDATPLHYRAWSPAMTTGRTALLFHRGHEHGGRMAEVAGAFASEGYHVFAWDQRGHGRSGGARGDAPDFQSLVRDADCFAKRLQDAHGVDLSRTVVVAHSVGAVVAAAWVHDYAPPLKAMVLATPAFEVKLYVPLALPMLRFRQATLGPGTVKSYVKASMLTRDAAAARAYDADPLVFRTISDRILTGLFDTAQRVVADAGAIRVPTLVLAAGRDWVVKNGPQRDFVRAQQAAGVDASRFEVLPEACHALFHDLGRADTFRRVVDYVNARFADAGADPSELLNADRQGWTHAEYARLSARPGLAAGLVYGGLRLGMGLLKPVSTGIRLGLNTGFDSGASLDYVYENQARGCPPLGWLVDRIYLNSIGWRGIRVRRTHVEAALRRAMEEVRAAGLPVHLLDVATGHGRYCLSVLRDAPDASAELCDWNVQHVAATERLAREMGVSRVRCRRADAFDPAQIAAADPQPSVAVVSGLYELFPENSRVRASLAAIAHRLPVGGRLVLTGQPWHPQMAFIARVLKNREGQPWVMRRRSTAEMHALLAEAGFAPLRMEVDAWGIFTVITAERRPPVKAAG